MHSSPWSCFLRLHGMVREEFQHRRELDEEVIDFLGLSGVRNQLVASLPHGIRKRVDLARALAMKPRLLLLDEIMAGMSIEEKEDVASYLMDIHRDWDITIIWIEHDLAAVMGLLPMSLPSISGERSLRGYRRRSRRIQPSLRLTWEAGKRRMIPESNGGCPFSLPGKRRVGANLADSFRCGLLPHPADVARAPRPFLRATGRWYLKGIKSFFVERY